jgi:hypothetical protein
MKGNVTVLDSIHQIVPQLGVNLWDFKKFTIVRSKVVRLNFGKLLFGRLFSARSINTLRHSIINFRTTVLLVLEQVSIRKRSVSVDGNSLALPAMLLSDVGLALV